MRRWLVSITFLLVAALGFGTQGSPPAAGEDAGPTAARPYELEVPAGYDGSRAVPLVVLLHGYSSNGPTQNGYFRLSAEADRATFLLAYPNGTRDLMGNRFWNATDACCDFYASGVDDVAYLGAVLDDIEARYRVDPARVYLVGHSNGAFMAHRFACDRPGRVAAIVTLAGMQWKDPGRCGASSPVSVLHVHGKEDGTIHYEGGSTPKGGYPGAVETAGTWAGRNACSGSLTPTDRRIDLDSTVAGEETTVDRYNCPGGLDVELWSIVDGGHIPAFNGNWAPAIWEFMAAHPKAGPTG
ncbi:MAG: alpha/beta hydrolase family esterase [Acidimicrobiia bacterium]